MVDLQAGAAKESAGLSDRDALDGTVWAPWHTILLSEEANVAALPDPSHPGACRGLVYEMTLAGTPQLGYFVEPGQNIAMAFHALPFVGMSLTR